jgi:hypothetical protein
VPSSQSVPAAPDHTAAEHGSTAGDAPPGAEAGQQAGQVTQLLFREASYVILGLGVVTVDVVKLLRRRGRMALGLVGELGRDQPGGSGGSRR